MILQYGRGHQETGFLVWSRHHKQPGLDGGAITVCHASMHACMIDIDIARALKILNCHGHKELLMWTSKGNSHAEAQNSIAFVTKCTL